MENNKKELQINVPEGVQTALYSNISQVQVTDREVIINFAYVEPNTTQGIMVAKIALNTEHARELVTVLGSTIENHHAKKGSV